LLFVMVFLFLEWDLEMHMCHHHTTIINCWHQQQVGMSRSGLAIYIEKYLKAKEEWWKFKYFTMQKYNLQKIL
jgi:hypothetical protein